MQKAVMEGKKNKKYRMAYYPLARQKHHTNSSRFVVVVDLLSN